MLRAGTLARQHPAHQTALHFYEKVLGFQSEVACAWKGTVTSGVPVHEQIDIRFASSRVPALLAMTQNHGPATLRDEARKLEEAGPARWHAVIETSLSGNESLGTDAERFFSRTCVQPIAEALQLQSQRPGVASKSVCPTCGALPQLAVLRPEGEGSSRWLTCSFCLCEWFFRRICCPGCGELEKEKLPRYTAEECDYVYVEACETCKRYLKAVDMSINGLAVPLVDEAALAVLDVWACDRGYRKLVRNLIGF